jgi:hypothetical protein
MNIFIKIVHKKNANLMKSVIRSIIINFRRSKCNYENESAINQFNNSGMLLLFNSILLQF